MQENYDVEFIKQVYNSRLISLYDVRSLPTIKNNVDDDTHNDAKSIAKFVNLLSIISQLCLNHCLHLCITDVIYFKYIIYKNERGLKLISNELDNALPENWEASLIDSTPSNMNRMIINTEESESIKIYPNPIVDILNIDLPTESTITLYNAIGQITKVTNLNKGNNKVDLSSLTAGIYILRISSTDGEKTYKIIKN